MREGTDTAVMEWVRRIPLDQIPTVLAFLTARLLAERCVDHDQDRDGAGADETEKLLTAAELAGRLGVPESWVRTEERAGRIPSIRLGKYVPFNLTAVERALAERQRQGL
jgi:excisionase family DNA binding protein